MNILALTRYDRLGASSRLRFLQYLPYLGKRGIHVDVAPLLPDSYLMDFYWKHQRHWGKIAISYLKRLSTLLTCGHYDLIWIEKEIFPNLPALCEAALTRLSIPYVVDYDDAVFHNYDTSTNPVKRCLARKIDKVMRGAALVVCGNEYIAQRAASAGSRNIRILPTVIDLDRYAPVFAVERTPVIVGWIGSKTTLPYLEGVSEALRKVALEAHIELHVIGGKYDIPGVVVRSLPWTEDSEVRLLQSIDIGIMPLRDDKWERGKCGYKLIQYMACGKPVIASPVGINTSIVKHGINGFLASNLEEWEEAVVTLARSHERRAMMGAQGRNDVEKEYCVQVTSEELWRIFTAAKEVRT